MKNLANCTPREFIRQTSKIRHAVEKWLTLTDILNIRKKLPPLPDSITQEERQAKQQEQSQANLRLMLDAIMDEHPDETVDLLALCCFVEPAQVDEHPMSEYLGALADMLNNADVLRFFMSLVSLGQTLGLTE